MESIRVFAPATVANVTCGFDILGFAVEKPGDEVILRKKAKKGICLKEIKGDQGRLSKNIDENTATIAIKGYLDAIEEDHGIEVYLHKKMPFGSGLGSSAASAVAGVFAIDKLLERNTPVDKLLRFAMEGEKVASGSAHADNVAPALYGGFVLIRSYEPLDVIRIQPPQGLFVSIVHPDIEINTKDARSVLKKRIPIQDAVKQWGNVGGLIAGLTMGDYALIGRSMHDFIIEPVRSMLIPGYNHVKTAALNNGALGCGISGSGPSLFAISRSIDDANRIGNSMQKAFGRKAIKSEVFISKINHQGPVILD